MRAATLSIVFPLLAYFMAGLGDRMIEDAGDAAGKSTTAVAYLVCVALLSLGGIIAGVIALRGIREFGPHGIRGKAIIGLLLSAGVIVWFATPFVLG